MHPNHKISVCTSCKLKGTGQRPGHALINGLRSAFKTLGKEFGADFDVSGVACMAGCDRPCTVAFHGNNKATYLFGDMDPAKDVDDLITFAQHYAQLEDGWCSSLDRPARLRKTTLARVPSMMAEPQARVVRAS